jgi:uncharacterized ion transporter superfamily protein YfcC
MSKKKKGQTLESLNKGFSVPDTYIIIFFVVCIAALLTYLIPQGIYETTDVTYMVDGVEKTRTVIEDGSFQYVIGEDGQPLKQGISLFKDGGDVGLFNYLFEGLVSGDKWGSAVGIIAFILVIGGAFGIVLRTGAVESGIMNMIQKTNGKEKLLIPVLFCLFSLGGAVFGMGEEALPFLMILVPIVIAMGYDGVTAVLITYVATQIGFGTSWMNPFSVAIAQGIAGVPVFSGATFRIVLWVVFTAVGAAMTMLYASKIKKNPVHSISYESDAYFREDLEDKQDNGVEKFRLGHVLVLLTLVVGMIWVVWGVMENGYYIPEIATQFFIMGLVAGVIGVAFKLNGMRLNDIATSFKQGSADLVGAAIIVGMAQGIMLVLGGSSPTEPTVLNTILHGISEAFVGLSGTFAAILMYIFQSVFNFFVVSGSGQAALTMPIMAPLADLLGVTRQTSVLAFQLGDALTNLIVPTSGCLMGSLAIARIDWSRWIKFMWKFLGILMLLAIVFIIIASVTGF